MLEVGPVSGRAGFKAVLFSFEFRKLGLQLLDPCIQSANVGLRAIRGTGGHRFVLDLGEINNDAHLAVIARLSEES